MTFYIDFPITDSILVITDLIFIITDSIYVV